MSRPRFPVKVLGWKLLARIASSGRAALRVHAHASTSFSAVCKGSAVFIRELTSVAGNDQQRFARSGIARLQTRDRHDPPGCHACRELFNDTLCRFRQRNA